jgi:hypothetical protein
MIELILSEAVKEFGNEKQKEAIIKNNGNLNVRQFNSLIKSIKMHYKSVEVEGRGKKRIIICDVKYNEVVEREDGRINNGKGQVPLKYEQAFPIMILEHLINRTSTDPLTVNKWLVNMGFITEEMFKASRLRYDSGTFNKETEKLLKEEVINDDEEYLIDDYVKREIRRLQDYFMHVVNKLSKAKIIKHQPYTMAKCEIPYMYEYYLDGELTISVKYRTEYVELSSKIVGKISELQRSIQNSFKFQHLTLHEINNYKNKPDVKEYWTEYNQRLNKVTDELGQRMYIAMTYGAHALFVRAGRNPVIKWLEKNNKEAIELYNSDEMKYFLENKVDLHETLNDYVVGLAEKRQDKFQKDSIGEELGGKLNKHKFEGDKYKIVQDLMIKGLYVKAYQKLQEYYRYTFKHTIDKSK